VEGLPSSWGLNPDESHTGHVPYEDFVKLSGASDSVLARGEVPKNYQRTLRPLYRLNFSSQVITGISSHKAWAMI